MNKGIRKILPGESPTHQTPPGKIPPRENSHLENSHLEYFHPYFQTFCFSLIITVIINIG